MAPEMVSGAVWRVLALARMTFPLAASFLMMLAGRERALQGGGIVAPCTRCSWVVRALVLCFEALPATTVLSAESVVISSAGCGPLGVYRARGPRMGSRTL